MEAKICEDHEGNTCLGIGASAQFMEADWSEVVGQERVTAQWRYRDRDQLRILEHKHEYLIPSWRREATHPSEYVTGPVFARGSHAALGTRSE
jgi:hypothetical protein